MKLYLSIRIWKGEIAITYNRALKQVIYWIGKRTFPGPFFEIRTK